MALFAIADLHLSLGEDKPMDVFAGWNDYTSRLENNWRKLVTDNDTVVVSGDISWAMKLEETLTDFTFIENLPGKKIFNKGNHDYWWSTKTKMDVFLKNNSLDSISILFNNSYVVDDYAICGTRGWFLENESQNDIKVLNREVGRLEMSIQSAIKTGKEPAPWNRTSSPPPRTPHRKRQYGVRSWPTSRPPAMTRLPSPNASRMLSLLI